MQGGHSKHAKDCCFTNQPTSSDPSVCTKICDAEGEALILVADRNLMTCERHQQPLADLLYDDLQDEIW
jgi:hypothetical protein